MTPASTRAVQSQFHLTLSIGASPKPKVIVVSHERSGTHFLMNSLASNFGYVSMPWINLDTELGINFYSASAFRGFLEVVENHKVRNVFKSHHEYGFYSELTEYVLREFRILYIYRNVYDVMPSLQRFLQHLDWLEGPKQEDLYGFITSPPTGAMTRYQYQPAETLVHRWRNHVDTWLQAIEEHGEEQIMGIDYQDLNRRFEPTIRRIANHLSLELPPIIERPPRDINVVLPDSGSVVADSVVDRYGDQERDFIERIAGNTLARMKDRADRIRF